MYIKGIVHFQQYTVAKYYMKLTHHQRPIHIGRSTYRPIFDTTFKENLRMLILCKWEGGGERERGERGQTSTSFRRSPYSIPVSFCSSVGIQKLPDLSVGQWNFVIRSENISPNTLQDGRSEKVYSIIPKSNQVMEVHFRNCVFCYW